MWNVTASLLLPLISVTNAVSSIIIIEQLLKYQQPNTISLMLSGLAVFISINIFVVCGKRILGMFRK